MNKTDVLNNLKSLGMNGDLLRYYDYILDNIPYDRFYLYFDDQGPKNCLFSYMLQDDFLRKYIIKIDPNLERLNDKQRAYYRFLMIVSFNIKINFTADEIDEFFDSDKMNEKGIEYILNMPVIFSINDRKYFKDYYDKKYGNNFIIISLLSKMNNNHYCLLKFLNDTINFNITLLLIISGLSKYYQLPLLNNHNWFSLYCHDVAKQLYHMLLQLLLQ